jgi:pimeloyl-ACP methyl ester carboxylesterase
MPPPGARDPDRQHWGQRAATFPDPALTLDELRRLSMPMLLVYGSRSPEIMVKIVQAIAPSRAARAARGLEKANHAMISTRVDALAASIANLADQSA